MNVDVKKIMFAIIVNALASVIEIPTYVHTFKDCRCIKILVANLEVKCHEIDDIPDSPSINPSNGINYWVIGVILLAIACFLLLLTIVVKHHMQCGFTIPCLLSY